MNRFRFYVVEYPNEMSRMGKVLWNTGSNDRNEVAKRVIAMNKANPWKDYQVSSDMHA